MVFFGLSVSRRSAASSSAFFASSASVSGGGAGGGGVYFGRLEASMAATSPEMARLRFGAGGGASVAAETGFLAGLDSGYGVSWARSPRARRASIRAVRTRWRMTGWKRGERGSSAQSSDFSDGTRSARNCGDCSGSGGFGFGGNEFCEDEAGDGREHEIVERGDDQAADGAGLYAASPPFEGFDETAQQH